MFWVLIVYIISVLSWGAVFFQLMRLFINTTKNHIPKPSLLLPLTISSFALFIESAYFGYGALLVLMGDKSGFLLLYQGQNWFLVKLLIAISGVLLLINLKSQDNKKGEK